MTKISDIYKLETDANGKVRMVKDHKTIKARKPACARFSDDKPKVVSRAKGKSDV